MRAKSESVRCLKCAWTGKRSSKRFGFGECPTCGGGLRKDVGVYQRRKDAETKRQFLEQESKCL